MPRAEEPRQQGSIACPHCGEATAAGARFCGACGGSLASPRTCPSCGAETLARHRFCSHCGEPLTTLAESDSRPSMPPHLAEKIRASRAQLDGERKQVTVLFADVMGSMELAEQTDPEELRVLMDRLFAILSEGIHRFEGTVDKFTGDGVMAIFGAPIAHEDHARRACYAALHLHEQLAGYAAELRRSRGLNLAVRIGLNSGEVVVGSIGDDLELSYTAVGRTVGLAQRMEQLAEPGKAYMTDSTARLVEGYLELRDLGDFEVKGVSGPLRVHELAGVGLVHNRFDLSRARGFSRFVGRDAELRQLEAALDSALSAQPQIVGLVGEPGVGKSRLCHEFSLLCRARGLPVHEAQGQAHAKAIPFLPVLQILRAYFEIGDSDSDRAVRERIAGRLLLLDGEFADDLPLLFDFLAIPDPERPPPRLNPEARQRQLLDLIKRLVRAQGRSEPTVMVFEDLHWIDPGTEQFLSALVDALPGTRGMVVLNFRPEYRAEWMRRSYYRQIPLSPLGEAAVDEMLADLLGPDPSLDGLPAMIAERTAGNPFFVEELVQALVDAGNLEGQRGSYRLVRAIDNATVPASVQSVLAARIDRLAERDKSVLQTASVIGKEFSHPVLAAAVGLPEHELDAALSELTAAEFLYEQALYPQREYAFKHPLTSEVAYGSQLGARRARSHAAVARAIEEQSGERIEEQAALIAQHRAQAGENLEAARWYARAAAWAGFNDPLAALEHWRKVVGLTRDLRDDDAEALALMGRSFFLLTAWRVGAPEQETEELFAEATELALRRGDLASLTVVQSAYGTLKGIRGEIRDYIELCVEALTSARKSGDPALQVTAAGPAAYALHQGGRSREALDVLDDSIRLCEQNPRLGAGIAVESPFAFSVSFQGFAWTWLGKLDRAAESLERGMRLAREHRDSETAGWNHMWSMFTAVYAGDEDRAIAHARQAADIAERIGDAFSRAWARANLGFAHMMRNDWRAAADAVRAGLSLARERRVALESEPWWLATLALAEAALGERVIAAQLVDETLQSLERTDSVLSETVGRRMVAETMLTLDGAGAARQVRTQLERALDLAERSGYRPEQALALLAVARLERLAGNPAAATQQSEAALRILVDIGAVGRAEQVRRELGVDLVQ